MFAGRIVDGAPSIHLDAGLRGATTRVELPGGMLGEPVIAAVRSAFPPHQHTQDELLAALSAYWGADSPVPRRLARLHEAVSVERRHLALPLDDYPALTDFGAANDAFIRVGTAIGAEATSAALDAAGLGPEDVDALFFTTVTGLATPTIDARLVTRLGLRRDVRRSPFFGLGCVGGAAGVARMSDYLRAEPDGVAVLLSVELCSLTLQRRDRSIPNLIATGLFGDGAAAVVAVGGRRATAMGLSGPRITATGRAFYPDSERLMGWDIGANGFNLVLSAGVPGLVRDVVGPDIRAFLAGESLTVADIARWIAHPGGPKVLDALAESLDLPDGALQRTWDSLAAIGNLSSASVLCVLEDHLRSSPRAGEAGVLLAMGPGFCAEMCLLRW